MSVATGHKCKPYDEVDLIHTIGKVSKRFQRIVSTKSLWKGDVNILLTMELKQALKALVTYIYHP